LTSSSRHLLILFVALALVPAAPATAAVTTKKSIWGPLTVGNQSQFPIYRDLGAGIYQTQLSWNGVAQNRPANPSDPSDPAYQWPAELDQVVAEAKRYGIKVSILLSGTPPWANGGRAPRWAPDQTQDFADFARAAARRYPTVHLWMIWGEPSRDENFMPFTPERRGKPLNSKQRRAPRRYAELLDAAYGQLKAQSRRNRVIGGNTFTTGDISPLNWIKNLRLRSGRPPRMDLYGHNPFSARKPDLKKPPLGFGFADFSDLDTLASWIDRYVGRKPNRKGTRLFLSEFFLPTDHKNYEFNFYVTRKTAAQWTTAALRIVRRWKRIYTFGWFSLYDDQPTPKGDEVNRGLLDYQGRKKPAYNAFRRG